MACLIKNVDSSVPSKWIRKYKDKGFDDFQDHPQANGGKAKKKFRKIYSAKVCRISNKRTPS